VITIFSHLLNTELFGKIMKFYDSVNSLRTAQHFWPNPL